jgi:large subunit ribosomal protein L15
MKLNTIAPAFGAKKNPKRLGRGIGSGLGKTCAAGHKGQKSRSGAGVPLGFEGGQMPMQRRLPKRGFSSKKAKAVAEVHISKLASLKEAVIDASLIKDYGLVRRNIPIIRVIGRLPNKENLTISGVYLTRGAFDSVNASGSVAS